MNVPVADIRQLARQHAVACAQYAVARKVTAHQLAPKARKARTGGWRGGGRRPVLTMQILKHLEANGPATAEQIALGLGKSKQAVRDRCIDLYHDGRLTHAVEGRGNIPAVYGIP